MEVKSLVHKTPIHPVGIRNRRNQSVDAFSFKIGCDTPVTMREKPNRESLRLGFQKMNDLSLLLSPTKRPDQA